MPLTADHEEVQALGPNTLHPPFGITIQMRRSRFDPLDLRSLGLEHGFTFRSAETAAIHVLQIRATRRIRGLHHNSRIMGAPTITPTPEQQAVIDHRGR